jgi:hypothetical protein
MELKMGFETIVLENVTEVLECDHAAAFFNGTLFVDCTAREATKLETMFNELMGQSVIVASTPNEFSFDFI